MNKTFENYQIEQSKLRLKNWDGCSDLRLYLGNGHTLSAELISDATIEVSCTLCKKAGGVAGTKQERVKFVEEAVLHFSAIEAES
jgi:hypothetical protein